MKSKCASISSAKSGASVSATASRSRRARFSSGDRTPPDPADMRGRVIELPDQRFLPVRPGVGRALPIGEGEQHQGVEICLRFHDARELNHGLGIIEISLLRHVRKSDVMIDQKDERAALLGRKLEADRHALRKKRAGFGMRPRARRPCRCHAGAGRDRERRDRRIFSKSSR